MSTHAERVRALRRLASGTSYPDEAAAALRKALELEALYGPVAEEAPEPTWSYGAWYRNWAAEATYQRPQTERHAPAWDWPPDPGPAGWYRVDPDGQVRLTQAAGPAGAQSAGFQTRFRR